VNNGRLTRENRSRSAGAKEFRCKLLDLCVDQTPKIAVDGRILRNSLLICLLAVGHQANAARVPDVIENLLIHGTARSRAAAGCQQAITSSARTTWPKNWSMLCSVASCSRWVNVAVQSLVKTT
jgi:hypothetical protein